MRTRIVLTFCVFCTVAALASSLAGCGGDAAGDDGRTDVAAAFYPLEWAAEQIGGDAVDVQDLTPPGAEPHDVELTARDVERIRDADVVLYLGGGFQPAVEDAASGAAGAVDLLVPADAQAGDPHVWLDPNRFAAAAREIGIALGREAQGEAIAARLEALDGELRRGLADCERRAIVTSHAAFGHLAGRYGLEQVALTGVSPEAEPSPRDVERLVDEVRAAGATTIFVETLVSPRLAETVARETGARTAVLDPIEAISEEAQDAGADYLSLMRDNLAALRKALGCR